MIARDVERISRDVLTTRGVKATVLRATPRHGGGWSVTIIDPSGRIVTVDVPDGPPSAIRTVFEHWADAV
jgi:hypothetical protein